MVVRKEQRVKWVWSFLGLEEQAVTARCLAWSCACFLSSFLLEVGYLWPHITQQGTRCHKGPRWFWKMLSTSCFPQQQGCSKGRDGLKLTDMSPCPLSVPPSPLASPPSGSDLPKQWQNLKSQYCSQSPRVSYEAGPELCLQVWTRPVLCTLLASASSTPQSEIPARVASFRRKNKIRKRWSLFEQQTLNCL